MKLALALALVTAPPALAQEQRPFVQAEALNPVASTLPAIDIATHGEQVAVMWFAWDYMDPESDRVITLVSRDANGSIAAETVSQTHSEPSNFLGGFSFLNGPALVDVTTDAVVSTSTPWNLQPTGGLSIFFPVGTNVWRHERQTDGSWLQVSIGGAILSHPFDLAATDDLVVLSAERTSGPPSHIAIPESRTVYAFERGTSPAWTTKTVKTYSPLQSVPRVDTDGETVLVGMEAGGLVEVHRRDGSGTWQLQQTLTASGPRFGCDVSIDGDRLAVSALQPGTSTFVAYVFERAPGTTGPWSQVAKLVPPALFPPTIVTPNNLELYRKQSIVALVAERVVLSQPASNAHAPGAGSADVFMRSPAGVWEHSVQLAPRDGTTKGFTLMASDGERIVSAGSSVGPSAALGVYDIHEFGSLLAVGDGPSIATPAPQTLAIDEGVENAGDAYAILGSLTGTTPGLPVPTTPYTLPLVFDPYFEYTLLTVGGGGLLSAPFGILDASGRATCDFTIPAGLPASFVGISIFHAAVIFDLHAPGVPATHVTNPVTSTLVP